MLSNRIWQSVKSIFDRTTPVQVVNSAYNTWASTRPQFLSNGWIVGFTHSASDGNVRFYVSKDGGATFQLLTQWSIATANNYFAMNSYGTNIYVVGAFGGTTVPLVKFDATTVGGTVTSSLNLDSGQTITERCSIAVNPSNGHITVVWTSKNATYPNSYNLRSVKSVDSGVTWTKQDGTVGVDQLTTDNSPAINNKNPSTAYMSNGSPIIVCDRANGTSSFVIRTLNYNGGVWTSINAYTVSTYAQASPSATVQKYGANVGRIEIVWHGLDATDTTQNNIRYSYSDDFGATFQSAIKLTTGNTYSQLGASISADEQGNTVVSWTGVTASSGGGYYGRKIKKISGSWGAVSDFSTETMPNSNLAICDNYYSFEEPLTVYSVGSPTSVKFYGKWTY